MLFLNYSYFLLLSIDRLKYLDYKIDSYCFVIINSLSLSTCEFFNMDICFKES